MKQRLLCLCLALAWLCAACIQPQSDSVAPASLPRLLVPSLTPIHFVFSAEDELVPEGALAQADSEPLNAAQNRVSADIIVPAPPTSTDLPPLTLSPTPQPAPISVFAADYNPLTGLSADPATLNRRPIVVKLSNSPALVRPQAGIGQADWVYEHYTEVGITRFSAIFYGQAPQRVGSIRSARLIDYELAPMYDALLAFAGASIGVDKRIYGSEQVIADLCRPREDAEQCRQEASIIGPAGFVPPSEFARRAYKGVLFGAPLFYRDEEIPVPHNLFVDLSALWARAERDGNGGRPSLRGALQFSANPPSGELGAGNTLEVRYLTTLAQWRYDANTGRYLRTTDGLPHFDANTEQQVSADNVLVLYAGHYLTDIIESQWQETIHWSYQITLWPQGEALLLRDGKRYAARWLRPSRHETLTLVDMDGNPLPLKAGNTFVQVVRLPEQMDSTHEWVKAQ